MLLCEKLTEYLDGLLTAQAIKDYAPNGLQVAGKQNIRKIISGVSANQALIEAAIVHQADAILVHHGFFWRGEDPCIVGVKKNRLQLLLQHDINLLAYHLPLDIHPEYGNNILLAKALDITLDAWIKVESGLPLLGIGHLPQQQTAVQLQQHIAKVLQREPLLLEATQGETIKKVAWCTGAGQDFIQQAAAAGVDAFISGEVSERTTALAEELGIHYFAAGHHATERYGVEALGAHLAQKFSIEHLFVDIANPV